MEILTSKTTVHAFSNDVFAAVYREIFLNIYNGHILVNIRYINVHSHFSVILVLFTVYTVLL